MASFDANPRVCRALGLPGIEELAEHCAVRSESDVASWGKSTV